MLTTSEFQTKGFSTNLITQLAAVDPESIYATDNQLEAIFYEVEKINSADLISDEFRRVLKETLSEEQAADLLVWFESELGKRIVLALQAGASEEALKQMQQNAEQLLQDTNRNASVQHILASADTNRLIFSTQKNIMLVVQSVVKKLNRPFAEIVSNPNMMTPELTKQLNSAVEEQSTLFLLNALKQFNKAEIEQYHKAIQEPNMQLYQDAFISGFESAINTYTARVTAGIGELFTEQGANLASHLSISFPEGEDLTFQAIEEGSAKLLVGWTGETLDFYIEAAEVPRFKSFEKKWRAIEKYYKSIVDNKKILKIHKGSYSNSQGLEVQFRVTGWNINGEPAGHVDYLIQNDKVSYQVVAVPIDMDKIQAVSIRSIAILQTVLILK